MPRHVDYDSWKTENPYDYETVCKDCQKYEQQIEDLENEIKDLAAEKADLDRENAELRAILGCL